MEHKKLYDKMKEDKLVVFPVKEYPSKLDTVNEGYLVGVPNQMMQLNDGDEEAFDVAITKSLAQWGDDYGYLSVEVDDGLIMIDPVDIFSIVNKQFALGVAYGRGEPAIYDIAGDKVISLR